MLNLIIIISLLHREEEIRKPDTNKRKIIQIKMKKAKEKEKLLNLYD